MAVKTATLVKQQEIAAEFRRWLRLNPGATRGEKVKAFDRIADRVSEK